MKSYIFGLHYDGARMGVILPDGQSPPVFNNNASSIIITINNITIAVVHTLLVDDTQVRWKKTEQSFVGLLEKDGKCCSSFMPQKQKKIDASLAQTNKLTGCLPQTNSKPFCRRADLFLDFTAKIARRTIPYSQQHIKYFWRGR
jgi:hypothetical protein